MFSSYKFLKCFSFMASVAMAQFNTEKKKTRIDKEFGICFLSILYCDVLWFDNLAALKLLKKFGLNDGTSDTLKYQLNWMTW